MRVAKLVVPIAVLGLVGLAVRSGYQRRSPGPVSTPHARLAALDGGEACDACHGGILRSLADACGDCHEAIGGQIAERRGLHGRLEPEAVSRCGACHAEHHGAEVALVNDRAFVLAGAPSLEGYRHEGLSFELVGRHADLACAGCHRLADAPILEEGQRRFLGLSQACASCHEDPHGGKLPGCAFCHRQDEPFGPAIRPEHDALPLVGAHAGRACGECHEPGTSRAVDASLARREGAAAEPIAARTCGACHASPHSVAFAAGVGALRGMAAEGTCALCHAVTDASFAVADEAATRALHSASGFALALPHERAACASCHEGEGYASRYEAARAPDDCARCHEDPHRGQLDDPTRGPGTCLSCHERERFVPHAFDLAKHAARGFALEGAHAGAACTACHGLREGVPAERATVADRIYRGTETACGACHASPHAASFVAAIGGPRSLAPERTCALCHDTEIGGFLWADEGVVRALHGEAARFPLAPPHAEASCEACHDGPSFAASFPGRDADDCRICHGDPHAAQFDRPKPFTRDCLECHERARFAPHRFDRARHDATGFRLDGAHAAVGCYDCHRPGPASSRARGRAGPAPRVFRGTKEACDACHLDVHDGAFQRASLPSQVEGRAGCARCHVTATFEVSARRFDHAAWTGFALSGGHAGAECRACHPPAAPSHGGTRRMAFARAACDACHADPHAGQFRSGGGTDCAGCHAVEATFRAGRFDHARTRFPLDTAHEGLDCARCHRPQPLPGGGTVVRYRPLGTECIDCHGWSVPGGGPKREDAR